MPLQWLDYIGSGNDLAPSGNIGQAINWDNVDQDLCRHMTSRGHMS